MADPAFVSEHGAPREVAEAREILRTVVGSTTHGLALDGQDDLDLMGIYMEPPGWVFGRDPLTEGTRRHVTARTKPDGARSGPGDVDLTIYSLRRYLALAARGNPSVLLPLWAAGDAVVKRHDPYARDLQALRDRFVTLEAGGRFLAYLDAQARRMVTPDRHVPKRPELVERYGYDVKYAAHAARLGFQGLRMIRDGEMVLPMPDVERQACLEIRRGDATFDWALALVRSLRADLSREIVAAGSHGRWPDSVDRRWLAAESTRMHLTYWREADPEEFQS